MNQINAAKRKPNLTLSNATPLELLGPGIKALTDELTKPIFNPPTPINPLLSTSPPPSTIGPYPPSSNVTSTPPISQSSNVESMPTIGLSKDPDKESTSSIKSQNTQDYNAKNDTDALQDILQYSGIDLKEEAENILKDQDLLLGQVSVNVGEDSRAKLDILFNPEKLKLITTNIAEKYSISNAKSLNTSIFDTLLLALEFRLAHLLDDLVLISRHRSDAIKSRFRMKIENDPKRQLFALEKYLKNKNFLLKKTLESKVDKKDDSTQDSEQTEQSEESNLFYYYCKLNSYLLYINYTYLLL